MSDSATPWTIAHQAPLSMGFSRQEYWSGLSCPETSTGKHPAPTPVAHQGLLVQMFQETNLKINKSVHACVLSHIRLFATPQSVAHEAPLPMGFFWQEYSSGSPFSFPGDLPDLEIKPTSSASPALRADSLPLNHWYECLYL